VLVSIVLGARVVATATDSDLVWQAKAELAAGTPVGEDDLRAIEVRLPSGATGSYLAASGPKPVGWVLTRRVGADELLPRGALAAPEAAETDWRVVTVPVLRFHYPGDLTKGEQVDVYLTAGSGTAPASTPVDPVLVLRSATVARVDTSAAGGLGGAGSGIGVELAVPAAEVAALVRAAQAGAIDLVRVPTSSAGVR